MADFKKNDNGKLEWNLLPPQAIEEILKVFQYGSKKYGARNWIDNSANVAYSRYLNALRRHLHKYLKSQNFDEESGLYELAHIATNAIMLLEYQIQQKGIDDRWQYANLINKLPKVTQEFQTKTGFTVYRKHGKWVKRKNK